MQKKNIFHPKEQLTFYRQFAAKKICIYIINIILLLMNDPFEVFFQPK